MAKVRRVLNPRIFNLIIKHHRTSLSILIQCIYFDNVVLECFDEFDIKRVMTEDFYIHRWFMHVFDMPGDQIDTCTNNMIKALRWRKDENIRGMYSINCKF